MRKGLIGLACAVVVALTLATNGCGGSSSGQGSSGGQVGSGGSSSGGISGSGGASASGGLSGSGGSRASGGISGSGGSRASGGSSGSGGQTTNCTNGPTCGGDLVGTWDVTSSCLTLSGDMDMTLSSLGCPTVPVTGSLQVTGTWTAKSDGTYTDNTTTTGSFTCPLAPSCLSVSSVDVECFKMANAFTAVGWKTATCSTNTNDECNCSVTADQSGGIGVISPWKSDSGTYTTSGSGLNADDYVDYSYCVSGNTLTLTPKPTILPVTGTIVLQKSGTSPGTGGAGGRGGAGGAGGATAGTGGRTGAGGATTGTGGRTGAGGATRGTGGRTGAGGATVGSGGNAGSGGTTATGGTTAGGSTGSRPCDIYAAANNTCVAAHSTVRALLSSYKGNLYQVKRADGTTKDIGQTADGFADSAAQDDFCKGTTCTITRIYDQSGKGNFLAAQTPDTQDMSPAGHSGMTAASATKEQLTVGGHKVYSLYTNASQAYWHDGSNSGMPKGSSPQGIYMVTSGKHVSSGCCYDYGNGPTSRTMSGGGTMDSVYFGNCTIWGSGNGTGPWVMADLEGGIYSAATITKNNDVLSLPHTYVTAVEKNNGTSEFTLRGADATTGNLATFYKGKLPNGYGPMKKQGAVILGAGGDCCYSNNNASYGTFYEGAIISGYPSDATDDAVQANVVSAGYGK
ncbi:MAG: hypothetical protein JXP73_11065 [Deltaproteobacteria bacterium]|nr:hypothetical protein [Deltaproteobacteria bacterium]